MSNIVTQFVRIYSRPDAWPTLAHAEAVVDVLLSDRGSYWVPVALDYAPGRPHLDVQYGAGKSTGLLELCTARLADFESVWVRTFDEGGALDVIHHVSSLGGEAPPRLCRYGFDELRVQWRSRPTAAVARALPWVDDGTAWSVRVPGAYLGSNDRCDLWHGAEHSVGPSARLGTPRPAPRSERPDDLLATSTTPSGLHPGRHACRWTPTALAQLEPTLRERAASVEYFWRGRLVRRDRRADDGEWHGAGADDWDNCLDQDFLQNYGDPDLLLPDAVYLDDLRAFADLRLTGQLP